MQYMLTHTTHTNKTPYFISLSPCSGSHFCDPLAPIECQVAQNFFGAEIMIPVEWFIS